MSKEPTTGLGKAGFAISGKHLLVDGQVARPGKTQKDKEVTGSYYNHLQNQQAKRDEHRNGPVKK